MKKFFEEEIYLNRRKLGDGLYVGIDLGGRYKETTGVCVLDDEGRVECQTMKGRDVLQEIKPYLKQTKSIAIDAPLTLGVGKGDFRLFEKFLSTRTFRAEKVNPLPPALMKKFCDFARELRGKLEKRGFVLDINLIEVFPTLLKKLCRTNVFVFPENKSGKNENQKSAAICASLAYLHANSKTRWLGYKDGFLFLPEMGLWKRDWKRKFEKSWLEIDRLKYKRLITNLFE